MLSTTLALILRITSNSALNALQKSVSLKNSPLNTNFKTYFILAIFALPLLLISYRSTLSGEILLQAFCGGIMGALGNAFLIAALKEGELSILAPINSYKAVVGLVFGLIILHEVPSFASIIGIFLIIAGSFFIFETEEGGFNIAVFKRKDIVYRFCALTFTAIEAVFIKKVIILSDAFTSFLLWVVFGCLFSFVILKSRREKSEIKTLKPFVPLSFLVLIMQLSTNFVFERLNVASALSLFQLSGIISVFLGWGIFKEKHLLKKLVGACFMLLGSVIIIFNG